MIYCYNGVDVHYVTKKTDSDVQNVFLHGWERDLKDFEKAVDESNIGGIFIDLPPFGLSGKIKDWSIFTYANMVLCLLRHLKLKKVNLIGHSFGGRIAIIVAGMEKNLVSKLVLVDAAGMKPKRKFSYYLKVARFKMRKKLKLNTKNLGSKDYLQLDEDMKKIFVSVVGTYLEDNAKLVEAKTLIIWGENDAETPLYMAKRLNRLIKNSKLHVIANCGHFCFLERRLSFVDVLEKFLGE